MNSSQRSWYGILIAVLSILMVGGALLTALAQSQFSLEAPADSVPTATDLDVPAKTDTPAPAEPLATDTPEPPAETDSPTATQASGSNPTSTQASTNTPYTFTPTSSAQDNSSGSTCGAPYGWNQYTVKTGDTLFSISKNYQTTVLKLQIANCMGSSTRIITGSKLWVPNNPTITPTKTGVPTATDKPAPTNTKAPAATNTPSSTATATATATATPTATNTPTYTPTYTNTATQTPTDTPIP